MMGTFRSEKLSKFCAELTYCYLLLIDMKCVRCMLLYLQYYWNCDKNKLFLVSRPV